MGRIWKVLTRKKAIDPVTAEETRLNRVLNTFDLTALGVGSTLGVGVYVLAGQVAKDTAGPSVVLSFLIAAVASVFAGLCYAEFGARTPKAGSAYIYSYVCVGEFIAFVIGWNLILEYVIGSASVARGLSLYLDTLINNTLQDTFREIAPINVAYLSPYFDFFSFGISVLLAVALAFGLKESSMVNNIVTGLNVMVVLFVIIAGSLKADTANWHVSPNSTNATNVGNGGFFPFGVEGMIKGAATCFYGFVGFDCIATTGEEVKNPRKAIPISIIVSLFIIFLAYFGTSTVLTLMVPYYLQDHNAPIPRAFETIGWDWAKWIVAIGALFGLCASLFGAMFPLPRIIYAMGSDGLVFKFLAKVSARFQTPVVGTLLAGVLTGLMSALFDLTQLVNMMSIGTLLAYTIVAASVLLLRYKEDSKTVYVPIKMSSDTESTSSESSIDDRYNDDGIKQNFDGPSTSDEQELLTSERVTCSRVLKYIFNFVAKEPNRVTEIIVAIEVFLYCCLCVGIGLCAIYLKTPLVNGEIWAISLTSVIVGLTVLLIISLVTQPTSKKELSFKVPFVPLIPALSILVNIYLMLMLDYRTWIRFAVWMAVGIPMYCMRACSQTQPYIPQNGTKYTANITNGRIKLSNGISNPTFVHPQTNGQEIREITLKKKALAPLPPTYSQKDSIEVQQEAAIAQLDEILDKEVAIAQLDDILNEETCRISDRKLSAGALSDMSAVVSRFEDVVADVHRANVSTPIVDPKRLSFPSVCHNPSVPSNEINKAGSSDTTAPRSVKIENNTGKTSVLDDSHSYSSPSNDSKKADLDLRDNSRVENSTGESSALGDNKQDSSDDSSVKDIKLVEHLKNIDDDNVIHEDNAKEPLGNTEELQHEVNAPLKDDKCDGSELSASDAPHINKNTISDTIPSPPIMPSYSSAKSTEPSNREASVSHSHKPTQEDLKTVTLRHVKKQMKQLENENFVNPTEDNLKVGSPEYKDFVKSLDNKLKRITVIPNSYYFPSKNVVVQSEKIEPNENVIEESINQLDAKEKLKSFIESSLNGESIQEGKLGSPKTRDVARSKSVNDSELERKVNPTEVALEGIKESSGTKKEDLDKSSNVDSNLDVDLSHKLKMEDVFRSIRFKQLEAKGDDRLKRRLSKSLGSSFAKEMDQSEHKQKMEDIFKNIKSLKKQDTDDEKEDH